jgi:hypothetical protein
MMISLSPRAFGPDFAAMDFEVENHKILGSGNSLFRC